MDGFERRREQKKKSILNAAWDLFKQYGYNKVSIAEIAKKASVSQVSIYNFFGSKENLKHELLKKLLNEHYQYLFKIIESEDALQLKFEKLLTARIEFFESFSARFFLESIDNDAFIKENLIKENYDKFTEAFLELFEDGKKDGVLGSSFSSETISAFFDMFEYYFINNPSASAKFKNNPHFAKEFLTLFFNALVKK